MKIETLPLGRLNTNCYLITTARAAVVVDPGVFSQEVQNFLESNAEKERLILLTHAHFDHIGGAKQLRELTGVEIAIGAGDAAGLTDTAKSLSDYFRIGLEPFSADTVIVDGQEFSVGDITFSGLETPGHTPGGMCYLTGNTLFSGDTLFYESIGRTDFKGGDPASMLQSVQKLLSLAEEITVYPGHGSPTSIAHERKENPYLRGYYEFM